MADCYTGPNPVTDDERATIWRWAKANGIDHGLPIDKVGDAINRNFFSGMAKPEWITDILSGRKTPYRELANDAWKKQYNRRMIVQQAKDITRAKAVGPIARTIQGIYGFPRAVEVFGHGFVFPLTHGGDLILRPTSWGPFFKGVLDTYTKSWRKADTERLLDTMRRDPLFDTALRSGLDVGAKSHAGNFINRPLKGNVSTRAWDVLTTMRYELWNQAMQKYVKDPTRPQAEVLEIGKQLAEWANHATGSAQGPIAKQGWLVFGPKLTQSKLSRLTIDPVKTIRTFANWDNATAGEKAVAWRRLSGLGQYVGTGLGFLAVNQGLLWATGQKQNINLTDPSKSDWLAFKGGGLEGSIPGMHSEIKALGGILAASYESYIRAGMKARGEKLGKGFPPDPLGKIGQYMLSKAHPTIGLGVEALTGKVFPGKPAPWSPDPGKPSWPRVDWLQYGLSKLPIPLTGPTGYVYDQMKQKGMSALEASTFTKALIIGSGGITGLHIHPDYAAAKEATKEAAKRAQVGRQLMAR